MNRGLLVETRVFSGVDERDVVGRLQYICKQFVGASCGPRIFSRRNIRQRSQTTGITGSRTCTICLLWPLRMAAIYAFVLWAFWTTSSASIRWMKNLVTVRYMPIHQTHVAEREPWLTCWHRPAGLCESKIFFCLSSIFGHFFDGQFSRTIVAA